MMLQAPLLFQLPNTVRDWTKEFLMDSSVGFIKHRLPFYQKILADNYWQIDVMLGLEVVWQGSRQSELATNNTLDLMFAPVFL